MNTAVLNGEVLNAFPFAVVPTIAPDLIAAVVARLRAQGVGTAMGETGGVLKIWSDVVVGSPGLPWLEIEQPKEELDPESPAEDGSVSFVGPGYVHVNIYANPRTACGTIRGLVIKAITDAPLVFADGELLHDHIRCINRTENAIHGVSVGVPNAYFLAVIFKYFVERFS